jgi:hypothetical protein
MKSILIQTGAVAAFSLLAASTALAASFTIPPDNGAQTLGSGETGTIESTGSLIIGGGTNAVTITGDDATLTNLSTLEQTGTGRAIRDNTGVSSLAIYNGCATGVMECGGVGNSTALMQTTDGDVIQMNKSPASVTLNNYGVMTSLNASAGGNQVVDFNAILSAPISSTIPRPA